MKKLPENHFSFKCPMSWDEMEVTGNGRFCNKCRKEVFDLTNCSIDEVIALQRNHGRICGSIRVAKVAAVVVSMTAAACQPTHPIMGKTCPTTESENQTIHRVTLAGTPLPPEQLEKMKGH